MKKINQSPLWPNFLRNDILHHGTIPCYLTSPYHNDHILKTSDIISHNIYVAAINQKVMEVKYLESCEWWCKEIQVERSGHFLPPENVLKCLSQVTCKHIYHRKGNSKHNVPLNFFSSTNFEHELDCIILEVLNATPDKWHFI